MKKLIQILSTLLMVFTVTAIGAQKDSNDQNSERIGQFFVTPKAAVHIFRDQSLRDSYDNANFAFQGEVGYMFGCDCADEYSVSLIGEWYQDKCGKALLTENQQNGEEQDNNDIIPASQRKTSIEVGSLALSFKFYKELSDCFRFYGGLGPKIFFLNICNGSPFVSNVDETEFGGVATIGSHITLSDCFFADIFFDYSFARFSTCKKNSNSSQKPILLDGITVGAGIGFNF